MAGPIATLRVMLGVDDAELRQGLKSSDKATRKWAQAQKRRNAQTRKSFKQIAGAVTAIGASFAVVTKAAVAYADKIGKTADKLGLAVEELQKYRFAAERAGIETRTLDMSMQRFTRRLGEAQNGTGVLYKELTRLGIAVRNSDGSLRTSEAVLYDYADAIEAADGQSEKLRLAFVAFDSEGAAMVNMFRNGSAELKVLADQMEAAGLIMSEETTEKAAELSDKFSTMSQILKTELYTASIDIAHKALPAVISAFNGIEFVLRGVQSSIYLTVSLFERFRASIYALGAAAAQGFTFLGRNIAAGLAKIPFRITKMMAQVRLAYVNGIAYLASAGDKALSSAPDWLKELVGYQDGGLSAGFSEQAAAIEREIAAADAALSAIVEARANDDKPSLFESVMLGSMEQAKESADHFVDLAFEAANRAQGAISGEGIASAGSGIVDGMGGGEEGEGEGGKPKEVLTAERIGQMLVDVEKATQDKIRAVRDTAFHKGLETLKGWVGANSKAGAAIVAIQEGISITKVIMAGAEASAKAWSTGSYLEAAMIIASSTAAVASSISAIKQASAGVKGQFHDGIDNVPSTGTYLLEKGERVVDKRLNADLKQSLDSGAGVGGNTVSITVNGVADAETINQVITEQRPQFEQMFRDINQDRAGQGLL